MRILDFSNQFKYHIVDMRQTKFGKNIIYSLIAISKKKHLLKKN